MSRLYLYGLVDGAPVADLGLGLAGEPLRLVQCGGLLAVAGELEVPPAVEAPALRAHDETVRRLATLVEAILPARFGTVALDERELEALLEPRAAALREALARVAGCEQMSLRVFGPTRDASSLASPIPVAEPALGPGARYLAARLRDRRQATALPGLEPLRQALGALIRAERVEPHESPPLLASVYHLVPRGGSGPYREALEAMRGMLEPLRVDVSGPWPPYAFAPQPAGEVAA